MNIQDKMPHYQQMLDCNQFKQLTDIQKAVIPLVFKSRDVIAVSKTGTGKTHAFLFPIFERITIDYPQVQAVITAPTRELATQIYQFALKLNVVFPDITIDLFTGGVDRKRVVSRLRTQPHIAIGTPGRLKDLFLDQKALRLDTATFFVVDEADMTLEYGFLDDIDMMVSRMGKKMQMLVFSATIPVALKPFLKKYLVNPETIAIEQDEIFKPRVQHILINTKHLTYQEQLLKILPGFNPYVCLIFTNTRVEATLTAELLRENQYQVIELHGDLSPRERKQALHQLGEKKHSYIVATDIASRGLDLAEVTHVVSLGFPKELQFYIHRSGRTGRAGKEGICYALYQAKDHAAITQLIQQGIHFDHFSYNQQQWRQLKPYNYKHEYKPSELDLEIRKIVSNKKVKVKPGYKKKISEAVSDLKRKKRRAMIQSEIKNAKVERAKAKQREKGSKQ